MKKMNSTSFQGLEKPENFGKLLAKGRRRSSKRFKACKGLYKIDWKSVLKRNLKDRKSLGD